MLHSLFTFQATVITSMNKQDEAPQASLRKQPFATAGTFLVFILKIFWKNRVEELGVHRLD